jgi:hypothetical protein
VATYEFLTTWVLESRIDPVWEAIYDAERWPEWWRGVESVVELNPGGEDKVGSLAHHRWRSFLPYPVEFESLTTRVERPALIEGRASGELAGEGRWRLFERSGVTVVLYEWNVRTTRAWMNLLAPVGRPVFRRNHNWIMARGGEGIARRVGARLLASS